MNCKITRNAAKVIERELGEEQNKNLKLRVYVTHSHGDHVHYDMKLDEPSDKDQIVVTDKGIEVLLEKGQPWLDGIKIDYLYTPQEGFEITNPSKGYHGGH